MKKDFAITLNMSLIHIYKNNSINSDALLSAMYYLETLLLTTFPVDKKSLADFQQEAMAWEYY